MLAAGKRNGGRWAYGIGAKGPNPDLSKQRRNELGLIADHTPDLLYQVRDDSMSLNAAYTQAEKVRDAERHRLEREERRDMVRVLSAEGMSTRAIASVVGAHKDTVRNDLRGGDFSPPTPPAPVTGLDGKTYTRPEHDEAPPGYFYR